MRIEGERRKVSEHAAGADKKIQEQRTVILQDKSGGKMNILEIIVIAVILLFAVLGFYRGFVKKLAAMVSLVLSVVLVSALLPHITQFLKDSTPVYTFLVAQCNGILEEQVTKRLLPESTEAAASSGSSTADYYRNMTRDQIKALLEQNGYDSTMVDMLSDEQLDAYKEQYIQQYFGGSSAEGAGSGDSEDSTSASGAQAPLLGSLTRIEQTELIENLPLPQMLRDMLLDYNNEEGYKGLHVSNFQDYLVNFIATGILNVTAFLVSVVLVHIALRAALLVLGVLGELPVLGTVNHLAGGLLGLLQALFFIWIFFLILSIVSATDVGMQLMTMVEKSRLLTWLYEADLFVQVVLRAAMIFSV